ncbi:transcription repressor OFP13-like [Curcuma longa]|uniref:transcription repressor OFP13-like n=1 Tax=Curcuma longa TaxID=136217 RepID=UPI003D9DF6B6
MAGKVTFAASLFYKKRDPKPVSSPTSNWLWQSGTGRRSLQLDSSESCFSGSSEAETSSAAEAAAVLAVARGMGSDRLFFEPSRTSSLVDEAVKTERLQFKGNIAVELDSEDPFSDFRLSMEEVVSANGETKVQWLEEMLCWYLKMNAKSYQAIIVEAFLDLLLSLASS